MADDREILAQLRKLTADIDQLQEAVNHLSRETGAREGRNLAQQVSDLELNLREVQTQTAEIYQDVNNMRKVQEFGSRDTDEIKKALAAIYRLLTEMKQATTTPGFGPYN